MVGLDRHPHDDDIVRGHREQHGKEEEVEEGVISGEPRQIQVAGLELVPRVSNRIEARQEADQSNDDHEKGGEGVHAQPLMQSKDLVRSQHLPCHDQHDDQHCGDAQQMDDLESRARVGCKRAHRYRGGGGDQGDNEQPDEG